MRFRPFVAPAARRPRKTARDGACKARKDLQAPDSSFYLRPLASFAAVCAHLARHAQSCPEPTARDTEDFHVSVSIAAILGSLVLLTATLARSPSTVLPTSLTLFFSPSPCGTFQLLFALLSPWRYLGWLFFCALKAPYPDPAQPPKPRPLLQVHSALYRKSRVEESHYPRSDGLCLTLSSGQCHHSVRSHLL
jgi:hypothetical protein